MRLFVYLFTLVACSSVFASAVSVTGLKFPNSPEEGREPVAASVLALTDTSEPHGFTELIPYVLRSPNQNDAGSCLYMSLTGIAEFWLARLHSDLSRQPDGPVDLSERYLMNLSKEARKDHELQNWKTDSILLFNMAGSVAFLNSDYRYTMGWYKSDNDGNYSKARPNAKDADYGTPYNWIDDRLNVDASKAIVLPQFQRNVLFADPESNQWNTGVMPDGIVETVKSALLKNKAPVQIIYNHFGYWHSTVVIGYDDDGDNRGCQFVRSFLSLMKRTNSQIYAKSRAAYDRGGGCHPHGVFYVRDSIYPDPSGPIYHYDLSDPSEDAPYSKRIVMIEYDWLRTMANHAIQISTKK